MDKISIQNYALSLWKRDIPISTFTGLFSLGIFFSLIFSIRLQFLTTGSLSLSSIDGLKNSPDLLFYLSVFSWIFLVIGSVFPRLGDLGIMMAVGGDPWICVKIHNHLVFYLTFPAYVLGTLLNYTLIPDPDPELSQFFMIQVYGLTSYILVLLIFGIPAVYIATLRDPYSTIRRIK